MIQLYSKSVRPYRENLQFIMVSAKLESRVSGRGLPACSRGEVALGEGARRERMGGGTAQVKLKKAEIWWQSMVGMYGGEVWLGSMVGNHGGKVWWGSMLGKYCGKHDEKYCGK